MLPRRILLAATLALSLALTLGWVAPAAAAYHHMGEIDSGYFLSVHPEATGTKLDSCSLCHSGGSYVQSGKTVSLGSCQWCHYSFGYDSSGDILTTLNPYGAAYLAAGRSADAVRAIETNDSDGDGFRNVDEIAAVRFPGDAGDDPTKVPAPYRVYTIDQLKCLRQHTEFLLMNATKSDDAYTQYSGVTVDTLLKSARAQSSATGIKVYSPDGFSTYHPLDPPATPTVGMYPVRWTYPQGTYWYEPIADLALNLAGWANYSSPSCAGRESGSPIAVKCGLKLLVAYARDGAPLTPGVLNTSNKLDGEGPIRIVPPQVIPGVPDQRSTASSATLPWPYDNKADHNAGYSTRTTTIIKVEPLPAGTTDINTLEAGWDYVDQGKIVVYGAIDPLPTARQKSSDLTTFVRNLDSTAFKNRGARRAFRHALAALNRDIARHRPARALRTIDTRLLPRVDGLVLRGTIDSNDWVVNPDAQRHCYWALQEIATLLRAAE